MTIPRGAVPSTDDKTARHLYDTIRGQVEHEDDLIGIRVGWLIAAEAFLFGAYGVALSIHATGTLHGAVSADHRMFKAVPLAAIILATVIGIGIGAAMHRLSILCTDYVHFCKTNENFLPDHYPPVWGRTYNTLLGHLPPVLVPPIVIESWIYVWKGRHLFLVWLVIIVVVMGLGWGFHEIYRSSGRRKRLFSR